MTNILEGRLTRSMREDMAENRATTAQEQAADLKPAARKPEKPAPAADTAEDGENEDGDPIMTWNNR